MRRRPSRLLFALGLVITGGFAACGARNSLPVPRETGEAGQGGQSGPSGTGSQGASHPIGDSGPDVVSMGGGGSDSGPKCEADGELCGGAFECCSNVCNDDYHCGAIPCRAEGYNCQTDSDCCQKRCHPEIVGARCDNCIDNGGTCGDQGIPCCSGFCVNTLCVPPPCVENGEPVGSMLAAQCCSKTSTYFDLEQWCAPLKCYKDNFPCVSNTDCCTHSCNGGRCGPLLCKLPGEACAAPNDCCQADCNANGACGPAQCIPNGTVCKSSFDCCSNLCDEGTSVCLVNNCAADASSCGTGADCCSGYCVKGRCNASACLPEGVPCTDPSQCCAGECPPAVGTCGGV